MVKHTKDLQVKLIYNLLLQKQKKNTNNNEENIKETNEYADEFQPEKEFINSPSLLNIITNGSVG